MVLKLDDWNCDCDEMNSNIVDFYNVVSIYNEGWDEKVLTVHTDEFFLCFNFCNSGICFKIQKFIIV